MPGIGRLDGIHGECTNGIDTELVDRYCFYPGSHTCAPLTGTFEMLTPHTSYEGILKNFPERWHTICLHSDSRNYDTIYFVILSFDLNGTRYLHSQEFH